MDNSLLLVTLAAILRDSAPMIFAVTGETITEKAGVINLSLDGSILLSAMTGFAVAYLSGSLVWGFLAAMAVGALVALIIAFASITLKRDQVAVGFVLTLLCAELSSFLGNPFVRLPGPSVPHLPLPGLVTLPVIGPLLFDHNLVTYLSFILILAAWFFIFRTPAGLVMQGIGERPLAAFVRGINVNRLRYFYTVLGGMLVGFAGAAYTLDVKLGWSHRHTAGVGWIALAIVIFGGWNPLRAAFGAYLFSGLQNLASWLQPTLPAIPSQVFQVAPFPLMILTLLLVTSDAVDRLLAYLPAPLRRRVAAAIKSPAPAALGTHFEC